MGLTWNEPALASMRDGFKVSNTAFQTISTRTSGFQVYDLSSIKPSMQLVFIVGMYIANYPVTVAVRTTAQSSRPTKPSSGTVRYQIRVLLLRDISGLVFALFCISLAENQQLQTDPVNFTMFKIIFEIVSAYGNVGLSLGFPNVPVSFCGVWSPISQTILCCVMLLGRHRVGLPTSIDKSVKLPTFAAQDVGPSREDIFSMRS